MGGPSSNPIKCSNQNCERKDPSREICPRENNEMKEPFKSKCDMVRVGPTSWLMVSLNPFL
jgi:hypothetical protein